MNISAILNGQNVNIVDIDVNGSAIYITYINSSNELKRELLYGNDVIETIATSAVALSGGSEGTGIEGTRIYVSNIYGNDLNSGSIGDPFKTIKAANASVSDNSSSKRYAIVPDPGVYPEDNPINMKPYVNIACAGGPFNTKITASNSGQNMFNCIPNSSINCIELDGPTGAITLNCSVSGYIYHKNITVSNCLKGLEVNNVNADVNIQNFNMSTSNGGSITEGVVISAGSAFIQNIKIIEDANITNIIHVEGSGNFIHVYNIKNLSHNVTNGIYANNYGKVTILCSELNYCTNAVRASNYGYVAARNCMLYDSSSYDLHLTNYGQYGGHSSCLSRDKIYDDGTGIIHSYGCDYSRKIFRSLAPFSVGLPFRGFDTMMGEGGSYNDGVTIISFDGTSTYSDVTSSGTIQFPNNNNGAALYFGNINDYNWSSLNYLMGSQIISGGSIEWQYYDGGVSDWVKINTLNTIKGYSDSYKNESFIGNNDIRQVIRYDQKILDGITESNLSATGWVSNSVDGNSGKWMRCLITSSISASPIFSSCRLGGNYAKIRANGSRTYHGAGRSLQNVSLSFGDSGSGGASKTLSISPNISYPFWNNSLAPTGTNELYFRFVINEKVDTGSGLIIKYCLSTNHTGGADLTAKVKVHTSNIKNGASFDGSNAEVAQDMDFVYTAGEGTDLVHTITVTDRIDISDMSEDDAVFIMIQRSGNHLDDDLTSNIDFSNVWVEYYAWQDGKNLI